MACAMLALDKAECRQLLGPIMPGTIVPHGSRVPGTNFVLDPIKATFDFGALIRWLDFNDTWLAQEWGHPSDNIAGILMLADALTRSGATRFNMRMVLTCIIKAYEIQGILALENAFNRVGLDHVILVKVATAAVAAKMLGGNLAQIISAVSHAWVDGHSLRIYRHGDQTGPRKSWAAGDASARGVQLAWIVVCGQQSGFSHALSASQWGFSAVSFAGQQIKLGQQFGSYVIENILYKVKYPAEFHGQTAVEAAIKLQPIISDQLARIKTINIFTQESAMRIINKSGTLHNYADRDHCLQYMVAVALLYGTLEAKHYTDEFAQSDARIEQLRSKMQLCEDQTYSKNYLDLTKREIANALQLVFADGTTTEKIEIKYPLGHKLRRAESMPDLYTKYANAVSGKFQVEPRAALLALWDLSLGEFAAMDVSEYVALFFIHHNGFLS